jgi:hypothetical protein
VRPIDFLILSCEEGIYVVNLVLVNVSWVIHHVLEDFSEGEISLASLFWEIFHHLLNQSPSYVP